MLVTSIQNFRQSGALLDRAVKRLWQGGWLALPSECGYRVVVRGDREGALDACLGCLPKDHRPWGLLLEEQSQAEEYCALTPQETALARFFWPGPLVLVSRRKPECPLQLPGRKLALRCPNHPLLAEMQRRCSFPLLSRGGARCPPARLHQRRGPGRFFARGRGQFRQR